MSNANAVSDFERAEHASNVLAKRVSLVDNEGSQRNPATEEKQDEIISAIDAVVEVLPDIKKISKSIQYPVYLDMSLNQLRVGGPVTITSGTVTTVTTVTTLSNIDGYQGKLDVLNNSKSSWANVVRARIS